MQQHRCIEAYFDEHGADLAAAVPFLTTLGSPGWQVTAIVPLNRLGHAHEALRDADVFVQAWWHDSEGVVRFTGCERA
jgi:hypothetical protein